MTVRSAGLTIAVIAVLALSACASANGGSAGATPASSSAKIELALSETCTEATSATCVLINGESLVTPPDFTDAGVKDAAVDESNGQSLVHVTFTGEGSTVLSTLTTQAVAAGSTARLVMKAGEKIIGAPVVLAAIESGEVSIIVSPGENAADLVDAILGH
ncbi:MULTISPECIES: SecDF P1 head subdomain-containing protein [Subtercola]|uniref:SecDF P1 head subdomain domain-containing protein n=1 Tax=Subtercola vilae TaxID=2056433 RepID=A0A4V4RFM1_9MICO|nr:MULTISPECIES: hypothetical protein [Subtercola]MEA9986206.1 hypothetical protein [Subtercola sp. RTI3]TIH38324.1 hypothetical protein D4765_07030 [Subtercola vilae]